MPLVASERPSHDCPRVLRTASEQKPATASPVQVPAQGNGKESREEWMERARQAKRGPGSEQEESGNSMYAKSRIPYGLWY